MNIKYPLYFFLMLLPFKSNTLFVETAHKAGIIAELLASVASYGVINDIMQSNSNKAFAIVGMALGIDALFRGAIECSWIKHTKYSAKIFNIASFFQASLGIYLMGEKNNEDKLLGLILLVDGTLRIDEKYRIWLKIHKYLMQKNIQ